MDFYEELGVSRSASSEEIRHAWKRLARLFHPDHQGDPELREAAELQMRRLNHVVDVLTNPRTRRQYDLSLAGYPVVMFAPPPSEPPPRHGLGQLLRFDGRAAAWLLAGALAAGAVALLLPRDAPDVPNDSAVAEDRAAPAQATGAPFRDGAGSTGPLSANPSPARPTAAVMGAPSKLITAPPPVIAPDIALQPPAVLVALLKPTAAPPGSAAPVTARGDRPAIADSPAMPGVDRVRARRTALAGLWRLRKPPSKIPSGAFAAERVEVVIRERSGQIYGTYRGRYSVPQHVASPDVAFRFSGELANGPTKVPWTSVDGNRGEISLHPLSKNSLEVVWVATHIQKHGILASGRAILARID